MMHFNAAFQARQPKIERQNRKIGLKPSSGDLLTKYLNPLINQGIGILEKVPSEIDKRSYLYYPVEATTGRRLV